MATKTKLRSRIELQVSPKVRMIWDELTPGKRSLIKKAFEKMVIETYFGDDDPLLEEIGKLTLEIKYDEKALEALKEILEVNDKEKEWNKEVKEFLKYFVESPSYVICGHNGYEPTLGKLKRKAQQLLEEAP